MFMIYHGVTGFENNIEECQVNSFDRKSWILFQFSTKHDATRSDQKKIRLYLVFLPYFDQ